MVGFSKYCLLALAVISLGIPATLAAPSQRSSSTKKAEQRDESAKTFLHKDWQVQSSCDHKAAGDKISIAGFAAGGWHRTDIPATVVGVLVTDKTYPDPNYGTNLKSFPGMHESNKTFFANFDMPAGSPFHCSWWYRTEFEIPAGGDKKTSWLNFMGINYLSNIWLHSKKIA